MQNKKPSGNIYVPNTAIQEMGLKATAKTQVQPTVSQEPVQNERYKKRYLCTRSRKRTRTHRNAKTSRQIGTI